MTIKTKLNGLRCRLRFDNRLQLLLDHSTLMAERIQATQQTVSIQTHDADAVRTVL